MITYEGLRLKVLKIRRNLLADIRRKQLCNTEFTIISNNCWGGMVYESYNLPKQSPTVGMFFMAKDYIKFLKRLPEYLNAELTFINPELSKWKNTQQVLGDKRFGTYPIGVLSVEGESVEIFFLHYHSSEEAKEKWKRRCKRIVQQRMIVKFNDQNGCTEEDIEEFIKLPFENKLFFTVRHWNHEDEYRKILCGGICVIKQLPKKDSILASYEPFGKNKYIDINKIINTL